MKISYLHIKNYKQFLDLELDLTYPKGHEKAGKPLDKICIIGQSGTGKTNLLDVIKKSTINFSEHDASAYLPFSKFIGKDTDDRYITTKFITQKNIIAETIFTVENSKISFNKKDRLLESEKSYFVSTNRCEAIENKEKLKDNFNYIDYMQNYRLIKKQIININEEKNSWRLLKDRIDNYEDEKTNYTKELSSKLLTIDSYTKKAFKDDMQSWEKENENILEKIVGDINSIIGKFNLELEINEYTQSYDELVIKDLSNGMIVEYDNLSTGTKNLLSTFIPLKSHKPKNSIILIDEPEMSFYPNIQRQLTELYMKVGENNQLIMATHSPLIASSFEPWEVVELKFTKDNQIYREKYYEGENHIDNYNIDPRMLTWTGILTDVFDLKEDSNFSFREKKLMEYASLKAEIKAMDNLEEKEKKFIKLKKISKILGLAN